MGYAMSMDRLLILFLLTSFATNVARTRLKEQFGATDCLPVSHLHYSDVIMGTMASQITSLTIVNSNVYLGAYQTKQKRLAPLALWGEFTGDR